MSNHTDIAYGDDWEVHELHFGPVQLVLEACPDIEVSTNGDGTFSVTVTIPKTLADVVRETLKHDRSTR